MTRRTRGHAPVTSVPSASLLTVTREPMTTTDGGVQ